MSGASVARLLRLLRLSRLSRLARLLHFMPELLCLVKGMLASTRGVMSLLSILICTLYIFAIVLKQLSEGSRMGDEYFPNIPASMYTLVMQVVLLDGIGTLMLAACKEDVVCALVIGVMILLAAVTLMNMLIGILCEVMSTIAAVEKESLAVQYLKGAIIESLRVHDTNQDNLISRQEFVSILCDQTSSKALLKVGVDCDRMIEFADFFFQSDAAGKCFDRMLSVDDFLALVLKFRGSNPATVTDILALQHYILCENTKRSIMMSRMEERMENMQWCLDDFEDVYNEYTGYVYGGHHGCDEVVPDPDLPIAARRSEKQAAWHSET